MSVCVCVGGATGKELFTDFCLRPQRANWEHFCKRPAGLQAVRLQWGFLCYPSQVRGVPKPEGSWFLSSQLLIPRVSNSRVSDARTGRGQEVCPPPPHTLGRAEPRRSPAGKQEVMHLQGPRASCSQGTARRSAALRDLRGTPALRQHHPPPRPCWAPCFIVRAKDPLSCAHPEPGDSVGEESTPSCPLSNQSQAWPLPIPPHTVCSQKHWAAVLHQATPFTSLNSVLLLCTQVVLTLLSE